MALDYPKLDSTALRNLMLQEMREFIAALNVETGQQLGERKLRIIAIEQELEKRKNLKKPPLGMMSII
jgi:hypothetical protein